MSLLRHRLQERLKEVDPIILEVMLKPFLDETKKWLTQKRQELKGKQPKLYPTTYCYLQKEYDELLEELK